MSTPETLELARLGEPGESCGNCGSPLAPDQRYCLHCGLRRAEPRVDYERALGAPPVGPPPRTGPAQPAAPPPGNIPITWPIAAGGAAVLVVALAMGVLIGNTTSGGKSSGSPQVITVG